MASRLSFYFALAVLLLRIPFLRHQMRMHAWVKVPPRMKQELCVIQQRSDQIYGEWWLWILNGNLWFTVYNGEYQFSIKGTVPVTDGTWHHVAAVRNGTVGSIYNGSKIVNLNSNLPVFIGYDPRDNKRYFHGELSDLQCCCCACGLQPNVYLWNHNIHFSSVHSSTIQQRCMDRVAAFNMRGSALPEFSS
ncbi:hypothetical protein SELMODRAFT_432544 [Selaginella moellendorffii]|uniref:Laminin G domain-containing protein n=1 Tax=Selaginella moellendorffii TaxID=88036 RepID=D8TGC1_SELML|nr:hypothetical protein SELMODRAFT_432544 [Selaginella moellendorffii]